MYRKCVTEVSVQHQKQVAQCLLELMQKIPYEEITVTQLCRAAGVTRRVFYHLFSNKTGALHALLDNIILNIDSSDEDAGETVRFFRYWQQHKVLLDVLHENGMSGMLLERMIHRVATEDYDLHYWLRVNGWSDNRQEVIIFGLSGLMGLVYSWHYSGYRQTPEELAAVVEKVLTKA